MRVPDSPCDIEADAVSVREAVRNVLVNALRHGARTFLHIELDDLGDRLELKIIEDGPGIPESDWMKVREPFSERCAGQGGASLGLSIVEEVMRAHHGEMRFEKADGKSFAVCLLFPKFGAADRTDLSAL